MQIDDYTLRAAADNVHTALVKYKTEPNAENKNQLVTICRHFTESGVAICITPEVVVIKRKEGWSA